jgi:hypothetical protein
MSEVRIAAMNAPGFLQAAKLSCHYGTLNVAQFLPK